MNEDIIYVWVAGPLNGVRYILCAQGASSAEAVERIVLKLARAIPNTDTLIEVEQVLRANQPMEMDFSERVGVLAVAVGPQ